MTLPKHRFAASSLAGVTDAHADRKAQGDFSAQPLKQWHWQHLLCSLGTSWQPLEAFFIVSVSWALYVWSVCYKLGLGSTTLWTGWALNHLMVIKWICRLGTKWLGRERPSIGLVLKHCFYSVSSPLTTPPHSVIRTSLSQEVDCDGACLQSQHLAGRSLWGV